MKFLATREKNLGCSNLVFHVAKSFLTEISQGLLFLLKSPTFFAKVKSDGKIISKANRDHSETKLWYPYVVKISIKAYCDIVFVHFRE